ncbi:MAG: hydantoinase/oxoprolinase family protein [Gammaproteobacteria bacterium]|nr:hydantoinase/oxoprolinase family protein [Gammaproteobacteria bacterium]
MLLGIDTGGTFTDFVFYNGKRIAIHKVLSTPHAPEEAILQGMAEMGLAPRDLRVVHGSTVATNAVLEGKGVRTAFITNRGLRDMLTIGRQARRELYNLQPEAIAPPVPRGLCLETGGRLGADGSVIEPLTEDDLQDLRAAVERLAPQAVAINLLFSFLDDRFERAIEAAMPTGLFVSRSSMVLPEYREYERGMTTWLNAYVGPLVERYLARLSAHLAPGKLAVMQSAGGTLGAEQAGRQAVHLLLSGPAAGLVGARFVAEAAGQPRVMTLDMGGTSTDVALIDGEVELTSEGRIGPYPLAVPMVDMHTIGAGGGSIATVDAGGALQVGPQSAGAQPGPACYGRGGREATVTDANLVLGRLPVDARLGGSLQLDIEAARKAVSRIANQLGAASAEQAADGIVCIANEHMAQALRVISVQRGFDPREFVLVSFGGAGGMHVCALAEALGICRALVPVQAGVLSALGMLVAPPARQLSRTLGGLLASYDEATVNEALDDLAARGRAALRAQGVEPTEITTEPCLDLCYRGQSYCLTIAWQGTLSGVTETFHLTHAHRYGHRLAMPVELINVRMGLRAEPPVLPLPKLHPHAERTASGEARVYGVPGTVPIWHRECLVGGQRLVGPAIIAETTATTFVAPAWNSHVDDYGNLHLSTNGEI